MTISTTPQLEAALKAAKAGETLTLAAGSFDRLGLQNVNLTGVTITSAGQTSIAGIELNNCSGLTFSGLDVTINARVAEVFRVIDCQDIGLEHLNLHDLADSGKAGVLIQRSTRVSLKSSELHHVGTALRVMDCQDVTVSTNSFHDVRGDAIQGHECRNVVITRNHFTNFFPTPGDHPDAIQFFTVNAKTASRGLTITDNIVVRGEGSAVQGIFLGNEINLPYEDVVITGNVLIGCLRNGIAVGIGKNVTITGNTAQAYDEPAKVDRGSCIVVEGITGVSVMADNRASEYANRGGCVGLVERGNSVLALVPVGDLTMLKPFPVSPPVVVSHPEPPVVVSPPVSPPVVVDVRDAVIGALQGAGLGELGDRKAERDAARAALAEIVTMAGAGSKLTSAAKMKPVFVQIVARGLL